jgi:Ala-tRNA(Pro) deacylase
MSLAETKLFADISALNIAYELLEHSPVFTVAESENLHREMPGAHTKNLFLKDSGGQFWLVTVRADVRVDLKQLPQAIGSKRLSFGKADAMVRLLGVEPGSVTPLAAINDTERNVNLVLDKALQSAGQVNVHPLRNNATIGLATTDLEKLLMVWDHQPAWADIPVQN